MVRMTKRGLGIPYLVTGGAVAVALLSPATARAADCSANPTPACHLAEGKKLIKSNPKRAAEELLASYKLDERTDTLELYAAALENDKQYALAAETWERIVKYRDSELTAAKEQRKAAAASAAQRKVTAAAKAVTKLEANTAKVRVRVGPGVPPKVTRDGVEVDITREVWVKAGGDELVFTFADGSSTKLPVNLAAGANERVDAPKPEPKVEPKVEPKIEPKPDVEPMVPKQPGVVMKQPEQPLPPGPPEGKPSNMKRNVGIALIGGGVILAGVATTFGIVADNKFDDARAAGCNSDGECPVGSRGSNLLNQSNDNANVALISGIGAAALIGTGVTLWMLHRKEAKRSSMTFHVSSKSAGMAWRF